MGQLLSYLGSLESRGVSWRGARAGRAVQTWVIILPATLQLFQIPGNYVLNHGAWLVIIPPSPLATPTSMKEGWTFPQIPDHSNIFYFKVCKAWIPMFIICISSRPFCLSYEFEFLTVIEV